MAKYDAKTTVDGDDIVVRLVGAAKAVRAGLTVRTEKTASVAYGTGELPVRRLPSEKIAVPATVAVNIYTAKDRLPPNVWDALTPKDKAEKTGRGIIELPME